MTSIRTVESADHARAVAIQVMAFAADPVLRWIWPEPDAYIRHFPGLVRAFGGRAFEHGAAQVTHDFQGGALWLPPGVDPDDAAIEAVVHDTVDPSRAPELLGLFEEMGARLPSMPVWHLAFIGVDPSAQGNGYGGALLDHMLARIDAAGEVAYLESTNPRNITLYQRHGFALTHEIRVGTAPPMFTMLRPAR